MEGNQLQAEMQGFADYLNRQFEKAEARYMAAGPDEESRHYYSCAAYDNVTHQFAKLVETLGVDVDIYRGKE
jgi:hypothetical protein